MYRMLTSEQWSQHLSVGIQPLQNLYFVSDHVYDGG